MLILSNISIKMN